MLITILIIFKFLVYLKKKIHKTTDICGYLLNRSIKMCWPSSGFLWVMRTV